MARNTLRAPNSPLPEKTLPPTDRCGISERNYDTFTLRLCAMLYINVGKCPTFFSVYKKFTFLCINAQSAVVFIMQYK